MRKQWVLRTTRALWAKLNGERLAKLFDAADGMVGFSRLLRRQDLVAAWGEHRSKSKGSDA